MKAIPLTLAVICSTLLLVAAVQAAPAPPTSPASSPTTTSEASSTAAPSGGVRQLNLGNKPWTGDFDAMLKRRIIRFLVPYSRTLYFNDKGRERGLSAELARDFERYINKRYASELAKRPVTLYLIPTTRDKLLTNLTAGLGDISAGNLTATDEREKLVDFIAPRDRKPVRELIVTGPKAAPLATLDDLAGKQVYVRQATSYYESLTALNERFKSAGKPLMQITLLPDALEDEDKLEMLNAGVLSIVVVDDWKAKMWSQALPHIKVHDNLVVRSESYTGWAIRKNSPQLQVALNEFYANYVKKQGIEAYRLARYMKQIKQISNNTNDAERKRFEQTITLFEKYGKDYGFDPLMLAAQGYQESQLNQGARSRVGAIGVMQLMPATGKEMGVGSISVTEANVHAGTKYMDQLMSRYFPDAHFSESERPLFAFASYNAGPGNIAKMRKEAATRGLDPDKWFNNVEIVVAEKIGIETTTYVRNIYKYYAAYKLIVDAKAKRIKAIETMQKPAEPG
ncbi:MltF family protein [Paraburkholderia metrosideri]|uniref:Membrane-bound lytic murein transglycosylase F n=1 Tax=Paraburkholderia metrosideri TaxID=580937 RepID=A0ABM8NQH6_9BURK|nr:transporter substrate-binding domain-containing protein [Paraburkholderia metrosideri]CAD6538044.1 Membrane-bound lytic murein transglycosylase F [Paraburkholderia metrosideri]